MALERKPVIEPQDPDYPDREAFALERRRFLLIFGATLGVTAAAYAAMKALNIPARPKARPPGPLMGLPPPIAPQARTLGE
jgi:hypothetical protein